MSIFSPVTIRIQCKYATKTLLSASTITLHWTQKIYLVKKPLASRKKAVFLNRALQNAASIFFLNPTLSFFSSQVALLNRGRPKAG